MVKEARNSTLGVIVTEHEWDVVRALSFIEHRSISDILYGWIKPHLNEAGERPDVQTIIAQKAAVVTEEI